MARRRLPFILERIRRCRTCGVEIDRPPLEYEEMPYCAKCLKEAIASVGNRDVHWHEVGQYAEPRQAEQRPL